MYIGLYFAAFVTLLSAEYVEIPVTSSGFSYASTIVLNDVQYSVIIDTASNKILFGDNITDSMSLDVNCLSLSIDSTFANFTIVNSTCDTVSATLSIQNTSSATIKAQYFDSRSITNTALHDWGDTSGVLGMSYPTCDGSAICKDTAFQTYLSSYTDPNFDTNIFGLDLNTYNSSMQLGGISEKYSDVIWSSPQATEYPSYHETFLYNLQACNRQLQSNWSYAYDVIIDTASVCVSLPKEFYESFDAWLNTSVHLNITSENEHLSDYDMLMSHDILPLLSFSIHEYGSLLHVSLADLIVNVSDINVEDGAPVLHIYRNGLISSTYRLCILRSESLVHISSANSNHVYNNPPIIIGSLALRSIYFAADFGTRRIAFANKRTYSNPTAQCKSLIQCKGEQLTDHSLNRCKEPWCVRYFFKLYDEASGTCFYDTGAVVVGMVFIVTIAVMEISTFLIGEYCSQHLSSPSNGNPPTDHKLDPVTTVLATFVTGIADLFLIYVFQWAPARGDPRAVTPQQSETSPEGDREDRWVAVSVSQRENDDVRVLSLTEDTSNAWS